MIAKETARKRKGCLRESIGGLCHVVDLLRQTEGGFLLREEINPGSRVAGEDALARDDKRGSVGPRLCEDDRKIKSSSRRRPGSMLLFKRKLIP